MAVVQRGVGVDVGRTRPDLNPASWERGFAQFTALTLGSGPQIYYYLDFTVRQWWPCGAQGKVVRMQPMGGKLDLVIATDTFHDCSDKEGNQEGRHGMW